MGGDSIYEIYVDMYFLCNFWMNLWVLFLCRFFLHSKVRRRWVFLYAMLGALGEVALLCMPIWRSHLKIVIGYGGITAFICYCLFRPKSKQFFYKILVTCYLSAITLGGILLGVENLVGKKKLSLGFLGILMVALVLGIEITYKKWNLKKEFYEVDIYFSSQEKCRVAALYDSGNGLIEPISKKPVSVLDTDVADRYRSSLREENYRIIPFHSIGKDKGVMEAYFIDKFEIIRDGERFVVQKPIIAFAKDRVSASGNYQMILHPEILS